MENFHYRNIGQIGHFFMIFHYAKYEKVKKKVYPQILKMKPQTILYVQLPFELTVQALFQLLLELEPN